MMFFSKNFERIKTVDTCEKCSQVESYLHHKKMSMLDVLGLVNNCYCDQSTDVQTRLADNIIERFAYEDVLFLTKPLPGVKGTSHRIEQYQSLISVPSRGPFFEKSKELLVQHVKKYTVMSSTYNKYLALFVAFFPYKRIGTLSSFEFEFDFCDLRVEEQDLPTVPQQSNFRSEVHNFSQSYDSSLEIDVVDTKASITLFEVSRTCPPYRAMEDEIIEDIIEEQVKDEKLPFLLGKEGPLVVPEGRELIKSYDFKLLVSSCPQGVSVKEEERKVFIDTSSFSSDKSALLRLGDGKRSKVIKISKSCKARKRCVILSNHGETLFSTDASALKSVKEEIVTIDHNKDAVIVDLREVLKMENHPKSVLPGMQKYGGEVNRTPLLLFKFVRFCLKHRLRKIAEIELLVSAFFPNRPLSIGKYLQAVGAVRIDLDGRIYWKWRDKGPIYYMAVSMVADGQELLGRRMFENLKEDSIDAVVDNIKVNSLFLRLGLGTKGIELSLSSVPLHWLGLPVSDLTNQILYNSWEDGMTLREFYDSIREYTLVSLERVTYYLSRMVASKRAIEKDGFFLTVESLSD